MHVEVGTESPRRKEVMYLAELRGEGIYPLTVCYVGLISVVGLRAALR